MEEASPAVPSEKTRRLHEKLRRELGPVVCEALDASDVIEIMLNPDGRLWIQRLGKKMVLAGSMSAAQAESAMTTVASMVNTTITTANPILECELPLDGSRLEAMIPPVVSGPTFTIRKKASQIFTLADYVRQGVMTDRQAARVSKGVEGHESILIVGGTGSGKTTLLNGVIHEITQRYPEERIITIEDTAELQCSAPNKVPMFSTDLVDMQRLLKATLRMHPHRILVGEVRGGPEALSFLKSCWTGHPGGACSIHAECARDGLIRLEQLISEVTVAPMGFLVGEAVDLVIVIGETGGVRKVTELATVQGWKGEYILTTEE